jgi:tetratricopeptide (TPR) repeat protein
MPESSKSRQALDSVFHLVSSGQLEQADHKCATLLNSRPDDVNIIALHGAVLLKLGRLDSAQAALEKVISLAPGFAKPYEDLGQLFLARKMPEKATEHFSTAVELDGNQATAYGGLANALAQTGKVVEAKAAHRQFMELSPIAGALLEAERLLLDGDAAKAQQLCNRLLNKEPENTQVLRMLARIASDEDQHLTVEELLRRIIWLSPESWAPHIDFGRFLIEQSRIPEAIEQFNQAVVLNDEIVDGHRLLGDAQAIIGKSAEALASYQQALLQDAQDCLALASQGHMLRISGDKQGAIDAYKKCTSLRPEFGEAWWSLASLKGFLLSDKQTGILSAQITSAGLTSDNEAGMHFALARTAEVHGDFETAWCEYDLGNSLKRQNIRYDPVQTEVMHDSIIEQFTPGFSKQARAEESSRITPIFILGMPRSGSTLIEQILASHSQVEGTGELPYIVMLSATLGRQRSDDMRYPEVLDELSGQQLAAVGKVYLHHSLAHRSQDLSFFTDKMPANFSHVGLIHMMLPSARIIDARRHPMATCVANFRQLYAQGKNQAYDLMEMAEYILEYRRIMDHWDTVLPGRVLRVQYEDVVADQESQTRRLLEYCGLDWEESCMEFHNNPRPVNTASAEQVREPIYSGAVEYWKNYRSHLGPVEEILAPLL